jgi:hypothetical protein
VILGGLGCGVLRFVEFRRLSYVEQSSIKLRLGGQGSVCCFKISLDMASSGGWGEFCSDEVS